jgi:hypothetical protein
MVTTMPLAAALTLRVSYWLSMTFFVSISACSTAFRLLFIFKVSKR